MTKPIYRADIFSRNSAGTQVIHRYADAGYVTPAAEFPAKTEIEGRLIQPGLIRRDMYSRGRTYGDIAIGNISVELANGDGELDFLLEYAFDGRPYSLWEIDPDDFGRSIYVQINGACEQPVMNEDVVTFAVRDQAHLMDKALFDKRFLGTNSLPNGVEGTADDLKGKIKPGVLGSVLNISPLCVNTSLLIYRVDGQDGLRTGWSVTVYDKRVALTQGADYTDLSDMQTNAPSAGQYRVLPGAVTGGGCFRLGSAPTGQITADVINPVTYGTTGCEVSSLLRYLAAKTSVSGFSFGYENDPECGIYCADDITVLGATNQIAPSVNAFMSLVLGSSYFSSQLCDPADLPYMPTVDPLELNTTHVLQNSLTRIAASDPQRGIPVWRVNVNYAKNYTVMTETDLAGAAQDEIAFSRQEYRTATAEDTGVLTQWTEAPELTVNTLLVSEADAQAEADRLLALHSVRRDMFVLSISAQVLRDLPAIGSSPKYLNLHDRVLLTYPRFGLDAGKLFLVIGMQNNYADDTIELTLWG